MIEVICGNYDEFLYVLYFLCFFFLGEIEFCIIRTFDNCFRVDLSFVMITYSGFVLASNGNHLKNEVQVSYFD